MTHPILVQRPDPFGVAGYLGVIPAPTTDDYLRDQARYAFANGFGAGVLIGDNLSCLNCQDTVRPYELHARHGLADDAPLCETHIGHVCGVDANGVRRALAEIAALSPDPACTHGR